MFISELTLQVWAVLVGAAFYGFYYHPRIQRHPTFLWSALTLVGYAIARHMYLRLPEGPTRTAFLVLQGLFIFPGFYFMFAAVRVALLKR